MGKPPIKTIDHVCSDAENKNNNTPADLSDIAIRWLLALIITGVFGIVNIQYSLLKGELALPSTYDDISYFNDGARYLLLFYEGGLRAVSEAFIAFPPHSPMSTGLAFLGYSIFGIRNWVGPAVNLAVLSFFSTAFMTLARGLPIGQAVLLLAALLSAPFMSLTVLWFRPDMFSGLLTASTMLFILLRPSWTTSKVDQLTAGLLLGAALWAKPAVFHLTIVLVCSSIFLVGFYPNFRARMGLAARAGALTLAIGLLVSLPYYALALPRIVQYIWTVVYGAEAHIWVRTLSFREHILSYLTGYYGRLSLGCWLYAGVAIGVTAMSFLLAKGDASQRRCALLTLAAVVLTYLAVTIPTFKGPHGYPFAAIFMLSVATSLVVIAQKPLVQPHGVFCTVLVLFSAWQWEWNFPRLIRMPFTAERAEGYRSMVSQAYAAMAKPSPGAQILQTISAGYINCSNISFEFLKRGMKPPDIVDIQGNTDLNAHRRAIMNADFVFALSPDMGNVMPNLPTASPEFRSEIIKIIEESGRFLDPVRISCPDKGEALIYKAKSRISFTSFASEHNIGAVGGPFPQWNLPQIRWGSGEKSFLTALGPPSGNGVLGVSALAHLAGQQLRIVVNGREEAKYSDDRYVPERGRAFQI
ncbi:MAG: hypothetical protein AB9866_18695 [Syntrophobacteraceae bacterium]